MRFLPHPTDARSKLACLYNDGLSLISDNVTL